MEQDIINKLKIEIKGNQVAEAILYYFSMRKRSRSSITIPTLRANLRREGYHFSKKEIETFFYLLIELNLCTAVITRFNNLKGIENLRIPMTVLGKSALEGSKPGLTISPQVLNSFKLAVTYGGRTWTLDIPNDASPEELTRLIRVLRTQIA